MALARRDNGVARDELRHDATGSLDAERERADIDEDNILGAFLTRKDTALYGGTVSDGLIGVDSLRWLLATEELLEELLDLRNTSRAANKYNLENTSVRYSNKIGALWSVPHQHSPS